MQRPVPGWIVGGNQGGARGHGAARGLANRSGRGPWGKVEQYSVADREADGPPIRPEVKSAEPTEGRFLEHIKTVRQNCPHLV